MKKAVLIILALAIIAGLAFAEEAAGIKVGAWGRAIFVPAMGADGEATSALMTSWGPGGARIGMTISGSSENVGFQVDFNGDNGTINAGDQQKIWVKPISMLTVQAGRIFDDTLRGNGTFGAWDWLRYSVIDGEDLTFVRVGLSGGGPQANFEVSIAPVEGAYIFAALGRNDLMTPPHLTKDVFMQEGQYGAGYTIANIGTIRAQYITMPTAIDENWGLLNAAFKVTALPGLMVDLGGAIPTDSEQAGGLTAMVALYANYTMAALTAHVLGTLTMYDEDISGIADPAMSAGVGIDYNLDGGIGINADFRWANDIKSGLTDGMIGGMIGVKKGFSNGLIGIALEITTAYFADWTGALLDKTDPAAMAWAIPIRLEYWF
jgi:hypothetical protein